MSEPRRWQATAVVMKARGWRMEVWWNPSGKPRGCWTARLLTATDGLAPPMEEGPVLAATSDHSLVAALDDLARMAAPYAAAHAAQKEGAK